MTTPPHCASEDAIWVIPKRSDSEVITIGAEAVPIALILLPLLTTK